jgi:crossover junction endodeoxyribonuclease RusA
MNPQPAAIPPATVIRPMPLAGEMILPWPARVLHPNARPHWAQRSKAAKKARAEARLLTLACRRVFPSPLPEGRLHLWLTFYPPDKRKRDDDGLLAAFKASRDGIADALGIDDARFVSHPFLHTETRPGGEVVVRITGGPE